MASAPNYNDDDDKRPPSIIRSPVSVILSLKKNFH